MLQGADDREQPLLVSLAGIRAAAERLQDAILWTPAVEAPKLSALTGARIFIKY